MSGALAVEQARELREVVERMDSAAREPFLRLEEVLEESPGAVVLPADELLGTQAVADHLGVSRMTVVRLIDRGRLTAVGGGTHRRVRASEVARYLDERASERNAALASLAGDIDDETPVDEVIQTR